MVFCCCPKVLISVPVSPTYQVSPIVSIFVYCDDLLFKSIFDRFMSMRLPLDFGRLDTDGYPESGYYFSPINPFCSRVGLSPEGVIDYTVFSDGSIVYLSRYVFISLSTTFYPPFFYSNSLGFDDSFDYDYESISSLIEFFVPYGVHLKKVFCKHLHAPCGGSHPISPLRNYSFAYSNFDTSNIHVK